MLISNPVFEVYAATDLTLLGRILNFSAFAATGNANLPMEYPKIKVNPRPEVLVSLTETLNKRTLTFVAGNDTVYSFIINQRQPNGTVIPYAISVRSALTGATNATIATQLNAKILALRASGLHVTSSGTGPTITIVADTGYPVFNITNVVAITDAAAAAMTVAYSGSTDATPAVFTSVAHGLLTGQYIVLGGAPTAGSPAAVATAAGGSRRVTWLSANTFSVAGTVATGTPDIAGGTVTLQQQVSRGAYTDLVAAGIVGGSAANTYSQILFVFGGDMVPSMDTDRDRIYAQRWWINELDGDYAATMVKLGEYLNAYIPGGVVFSTETLALTP